MFNTKRYLAIAGLFLRLCCDAAIGGEQVPLRRTLLFHGAEREYFVALPKNYHPETTYWPLIVVHGGGGHARTNPKALAMRRKADELDLPAILILTQFNREDKQVSRFPVLGEGAFLKAVLEDVRSEYRLHSKILLNGYSMGGQFAHRFALAHPEMVHACAPFAAGTWSTPDGRLLIEQYGEVRDPKAFLSSKENAVMVPDRLGNLFDQRTAEAACLLAAENASDVPFLVMCGSLDPRYSIAVAFAASLREAGFSVETGWPRTPHNAKSKRHTVEFEKYPDEAIRFFKKHTEGSVGP